MTDAQLQIALSMTGQAEVSAGLNSVTNTAVAQNNVLSENRIAIRELAMGMTQIGVAALGVGVAMKESNNQLISSVGSYVMLAGGIMSAVGSSVQFISAISKMVDALKKLQAAEILTQAFSGPAGWATLGIGAAVAVGATVGISRYEASQNKAEVNINNQIKLDGKQIATSNQRQTILIQNRNSGTGFRQ